MSTPQDPTPQFVTVTPEPTADELAAILSAHGELWPESIPPGPPQTSTRWRFSGRWWTDHPARRPRKPTRRD